MQFLETVLIIILIYFAVKILLRFLTPYIMKYFAKKITKRFGKGFGGPPNTKQTNKTEGSISIDKTPPQSKKSNNSVGEYVDYEEID